MLPTMYSAQITLAVLLYSVLIVPTFGTFGIKPLNNSCPRLGLYLFAPLVAQCEYNPDVLSDVPTMVTRRGYIFETHHVKTSDGYFLTLFRINSPVTSRTLGPLFLQHGIISSSDPWVDKGPKSLDLGYDVWLGNLRGTTYSKGHEIYDVDCPSFWNYNLDDLAEYDFRGQIASVADITGSKVSVVGHSLGTTLPFMYAAMFPEEAEEVLERIIALAPVAYLDGVGIIEFIKPFGFIFTRFAELIGLKGLFYDDWYIHPVLTTVCRIFPGPCYLLINVIYGPTTQFPARDLLLLYSYWPTGVSIDELKHYLQIASSGRFQKFDYGVLGNLIKYQTWKPPRYDLGNIRVPVCLLYGEKDSLYTERNLQRLHSELGSSIVGAYSIKGGEDKPFAHMDFLYSEHFEDMHFKMISRCL